MQNRIANLLTVKSIVTIVLTAVFSVLALRGSISGTEFSHGCSLFRTEEIVRLLLFIFVPFR